MSKTVNTKILLRNDLATNWTTQNPTLGKGEIGVEVDTKKFKFGDGINTYYNLPYSTLTPDEINTLVENNKGGIEICDTQPDFACMWFQPMDYQNLYTFFHTLHF